MSQRVWNVLGAPGQLRSTVLTVVFHMQVRQALFRVLFLPENSEKHGRIQALVGLVFTMIDSCPSSGPQLPAAVRSSNLGSVLSTHTVTVS